MARAADARSDAEYVVDRCESCGLGVSRLAGPTPEEELAALARALPDGSLELALPNRSSLQAALGEGHWAALELPAQEHYFAPRSLSLALERAGLSEDRRRFRLVGRNLRWMWQTLLNGLTLRDNFAREALAGRLRPGGGWATVRYAIDAMVSALAAIPVAIIALPFELIAVAFGRGGELVVTVRPAAGGRPSGEDGGPGLKPRSEAR